MRKILFIYLILFSTAAFAQNSEKLLTLEEALNHAIEYSPTLSVEKIKLKEASIQVEERRLQQIPEIFVSGNLSRNLIISATPVPAHVFNPNAQEGELMYIKFNTKWNSSTGLNLNYDLFNPENINSIAEQQHQLKIQEYDTQISEEELKERVAIAYAECVIADEQKQMLKVDTTYYSELLKNANKLFDKEKISLSEKNEAHSSYNESIINYLEAEKIVKERKAQLLYLLGIDVTKENIELISLQEDIPTLLEKMDKNASAAFALSNLEELRQQEVVDLAIMRVKSASLKYAPTISLQGYYGTNFYNNELSLFNNNLWRGNSYIGISLRVPITQSLSTSKEVSRLRLNKQIEFENLRDIKNSTNKERLNELSLLQVRKENYRLSKENWEMSIQNSDAIQMQFEKGYIQQADLLNEMLKIKQYRQKFLQSAYDLINSFVTLK